MYSTFIYPISMGTVRAVPEALLCKGNIILIYPYLFFILHKEKYQNDYIITFFAYQITGILYQC